MKVFAITNQKGGVGKTTTATTLYSVLSSKGYKTLLIDADVQGNSTDTFRAKYEGVATLYDVILEEREQAASLEEAIQVTAAGHIVASDPLLRKADEILKSEVDGLYRLKHAIKDLKGYDYVIIDTPPSMNSLLYNSLIAANRLIVPITAGRYSLQGLSQLNRTILAIKNEQNPGLEIEGILLTMYFEQKKISRQVREELDEIAKKMSTKVIEVPIRKCVKTEEAQARQKLLMEYAKNCTTMEDYVAVGEILLREENGDGEESR